MNSHLTSHIAREHVNDLIAIAERERLVRAVGVQTREPRLLTRLAAIVRRRHPAPAPAAPAPCRTPARP